jgi:hypothetical protein
MPIFRVPVSRVHWREVGYIDVEQHSAAAAVEYVEHHGHEDWFTARVVVTQAQRVADSGPEFWDRDTYAEDGVEEIVD